MSKIFGSFRKLSNIILREPNIYSENVIVYNKRQKYFEEYTRTYYVNSKDEHICLNTCGNICNICKGNGIIFNTKSITDFNYFNICKNCNGRGYL